MVFGTAVREKSCSSAVVVRQHVFIWKTIFMKVFFSKIKIIIVYLFIFD